MSTLKEYYHLKRDKFSISPKEDAEQYFGRHGLQDRIRRRMESDFLEARAVPKFFIHGQYGAGKTHTLHHIEYVMSHDPDFLRDFPATEPIPLELGPMKSKEKWLMYHRRLMDAIGLQRLRAAVGGVLPGAGGMEDPVTAFRQAGVMRFGDAAIQNSQAHIYRNLMFGGRQQTLSWEWLKGKALSVDDAQTLTTETNLSEASDLIACILNIGTLMRQGLGRKIVFLVDEGEALRALTNADSIDEFVFGFRRLVDNENDVVGLVVAYQTEGGMEEAPGILGDEAIRGRVGYDDGYIDLTDLVSEVSDVKDFIVGVIGHLVDSVEAKNTIEAEGLGTEPEFFPFTEAAVDLITDFVMQEPSRQLPRHIISRLSSAVVEGWRRRQGVSGHVLVDEDLVNDILYPYEV